jgi:hypothetical protein
MRCQGSPRFVGVEPLPLWLRLDMASQCLDSLTNNVIISLYEEYIFFQLSGITRQHTPGGDKTFQITRTQRRQPVILGTARYWFVLGGERIEVTDTVYVEVRIQDQVLLYNDHADSAPRPQDSIFWSLIHNQPERKLTMKERSSSLSSSEQLVQMRSDLPLSIHRRCIPWRCIPDRVGITTLNPSIATRHEAFVPDRALDRPTLRLFLVVVSVSILCSGLISGQKVDEFGSSASGFVLAALALVGLEGRDGGGWSRGRDV